MEGFIEWLFDALSKRWRLWAVVIIVAVALIVIVVATLYHQNRSQWLELASEFSKLLLTAVVASVVFKILVLEGYFTTALSRIIYDDKGLEHLTDAERQSLWRKLTIIVYAPFLRQNVQSKDTDAIRKLADNLATSVTSSFNYNHNFYHKDWIRTYEFAWEPGSETKTILMKDIFRSKIIPFRPAEPVDWVTLRIAEAHLGTGDYHTVEREIKLNGHPPDQKV